MEIQILGTKKCPDTKKALRFFLERGLKPHFRDISEKPLSPGELANIARSAGTENLIDTGSREFSERGYSYRVYDPIEELLENWKLLRTPVVRSGSKAVLGYAPEQWKVLL